MSNVIDFQKYVHNREHVAMGCGPQETCALCKQGGMGDTVPETPILTKKEIEKYIMIGIISSIVGGVVTELVVRRLIFKKKE